MLNLLAYDSFRLWDWTSGKEKNSFTLRPQTTPLVKDRLRKADLSVRQWLNRSGIPKPQLQGRWQQTSLRTIGFRPPDSNVERDCLITNQKHLGKGSTQSVKNHGKDVHNARLLLPLKNKRLRNQRYLPALLPLSVNPTNFTPVRDRGRTTLLRWWQVPHSRGRVHAGERHLLRCPTAHLRSFRN